jgi:Ala-tRNA(Pro) deacylase
MPTAKLKSFLDANSIKYLTIQHSPAYTSQEVAAKLHVHGSELAKTTILKLDERFVMAVLAAPDQVDMDRFRDVTGAKAVSLASEKEFKDLFPGCDVGAMPPFGNLYDMPVWVDERLSRDPSIVFNAGTHTEAVRMDYPDFARLVQPKSGKFRRG